MDAIEFIRNLHDTYEGTNDRIEHGCCVCSKTSLKGNYWEGYEKVLTWSCDCHSVFYVPLIQKILADVVHPINLEHSQNNILTKSQQNSIKNKLNIYTKKCPLCPQLNDKPDCLKPYYRLPVQSGTIIMFGLTIDPNIVDKDITSEEPILIDVTGYRGTGLHVVHKNGISEVERDEYYPIWHLYHNYITPKVIGSFDDCTEGFHINENLMYSFLDDLWYSFGSDNQDQLDENQNEYEWDKVNIKNISEKEITVRYSDNKFIILSKTSCILNDNDDVFDIMKINKIYN